MPKRLTEAQILGQQGVNLIEDRVLAMGFAWHPTNPALEVGIDGQIEIRDVQTGRMSGGPAKLSKEDRTPHLEQEDAANLLHRALSIYRREHRTMPARLVCHKSSNFTDAEIAGFRDGAQQERIDALDLVSMRKSRTRLYRHGSYPPLRGTYLELDGDESLLYTNGSLDFYRCYPGLYVPRPLSLTWDAIQQAPRKLLREILALTKMNWNTTVFANAEPITICAARVVGDIMRHIGPDDPVQEGYSYYM
jgi:hypothetical protein